MELLCQHSTEQNLPAFNHALTDFALMTDPQVQQRHLQTAAQRGGRGLRCAPAPHSRQGEDGLRWILEVMRFKREKTKKHTKKSKWQFFYLCSVMFYMCVVFLNVKLLYFCGLYAAGLMAVRVHAIL